MRLAIIIPFRNRETHLNKMLPHTVSFFRRATSIEPLFVVSEQGDDEEFNRGALLNHGYLLCRGIVDYVCFHDVDYLPMWADYSDPSLPSRIIWWGMDQRPVGHGTTSVVTARKTGLAAVSVMKKWHFEAANGYSNGYWGWGFEDTDLQRRLEVAGIPLGYRDGTFLALDHDSNGFTATGPSPASTRNQARFQTRKFPSSEDGLSSVADSQATLAWRIATGLGGEKAPLLWSKHFLKRYRDQA